MPTSFPTFVDVEDPDNPPVGTPLVNAAFLNALIAALNAAEVSVSTFTAQLLSQASQITTAEATANAAQTAAEAALPLTGGTLTGAVEIDNVGTAPTTSPTDGGVLYAQGGALKWRGSSGTVTVVAPA